MERHCFTKSACHDHITQDAQARPAWPNSIAGQHENQCPTHTRAQRALTYSPTGPTQFNRTCAVRQSYAQLSCIHPSTHARTHLHPHNPPTRASTQSSLQPVIDLLRDPSTHPLNPPIQQPNCSPPHLFTNPSIHPQSNTHRHARPQTCKTPAMATTNTKRARLDMHARMPAGRQIRMPSLAQLDFLHGRRAWFFSSTEARNRKVRQAHVPAHALVYIHATTPDRETRTCAC